MKPPPKTLKPKKTKQNKKQEIKKQKLFLINRRTEAGMDMNKSRNGYEQKQERI